MVPLSAAFRRAAFLAVVLACPLSAVAAEGPAAGLPVHDLADCVAIALQESPTLAIAAENTGIAGQGVRQAKGQFLPSLSLSRTWQKSERTEYDYENPVTLAISDYTEKSKYKDYGASSDFYLFRGPALGVVGGRDGDVQGGAGDGVAARGRGGPAAEDERGEQAGRGQQQGRGRGLRPRRGGVADSGRRFQSYRPAGG